MDDTIQSVADIIFGNTNGLFGKGWDLDKLCRNHLLPVEEFLTHIELLKNTRGKLNWEILTMHNDVDINVIKRLPQFPWDMKYFPFNPNFKIEDLLDNPMGVNGSKWNPAFLRRMGVLRKLQKYKNDHPEMDEIWKHRGLSYCVWSSLYKHNLSDDELMWISGKDSLPRDFYTNHNKYWKINWNIEMILSNPSTTTYELYSNFMETNRNSSKWKLSLLNKEQFKTVAILNPIFMLDCIKNKLVDNEFINSLQGIPHYDFLF